MAVIYWVSDWLVRANQSISESMPSVLKSETVPSVLKSLFSERKKRGGGGMEGWRERESRSAWGKFREFLPILTNKSISSKTRGQIHTECMGAVMLYG